MLLLQLLIFQVAYNSLQRHSSGNMDYDNVENCVTTNGRDLGLARTGRPLGDGLGGSFVIFHIIFICVIISCLRPSLRYFQFYPQIF